MKEVSKEKELELSNFKPPVGYKQSVSYMTDGKGNPSSMRLMCVVCVIAGVLQSFLGVFAVFSGNPSALQILSFSGTLIAAGFTGKFLQKGQEIKKDQ